MLSKSERDAIRARAEKATPVARGMTELGRADISWTLFAEDGSRVSSAAKHSDVTFQKNARCDVLALLDALDETEQRAEKAEETIRALEYKGEPGISDPVADLVGRLERLKHEVGHELSQNLDRIENLKRDVRDTETPRRRRRDIERLQAEIHDLKAGIKLVQDSCDAGIAERDAKIKTLKAEIEIFKAELKRIDDDKAYLVQANLANDWEERYQCQAQRIEMKDMTIAAMRRALEQCSMCGGSGQMRGIKKDCDTGACSEFFEDCMACAQFRAALESGAGSKLLADHAAEIARKDATIARFRQALISDGCACRPGIPSEGESPYKCYRCVTLESTDAGKELLAEHAAELAKTREYGERQYSELMKAHRWFARQFGEQMNGRDFDVKFSIADAELAALRQRSKTAEAELERLSNLLNAAASGKSTAEHRLAAVCCERDALKACNDSQAASTARLWDILAPGYEGDLNIHSVASSVVARLNAMAKCAEIAEAELESLQEQVSENHSQALQSIKAGGRSIPFPVRVDGAYALPGEGHGVASNVGELLALIGSALRLSPISELRIALQPSDLQAQFMTMCERAEAAKTKNESAGHWRVGARVPLNVYKNDVPMFQCHTPEDAARVVGLLNRVEAAESRIIELESAILNAHGRGLPANWVYDDPETTLDLFVAETATLRHELRAAEAEAERLRSTDLVDRALCEWQKEAQGLLAQAKFDAARLDWREKNPSSAEPMAVWRQDGWKWRYMGKYYGSERAAIDAALRDEEPDGKS